MNFPLIPHEIALKNDDISEKAGFVSLSKKRADAGRRGGRRAAQNRREGKERLKRSLENATNGVAQRVNY
jgi:hypothetical protein